MTSLAEEEKGARKAGEEGIQAEGDLAAAAAKVHHDYHSEELSLK